MSDPKELRRNAQDCLTHARAVTDAQDKFLLLNMALAWLKLSQQVEQLQAERGNGGGGTGDDDDREPRDDPHNAG
jgi:hypothetical protein